MIVLLVRLVTVELETPAPSPETILVPNPLWPFLCVLPLSSIDPFSTAHCVE
ncbi:hypothetical protein SESBI_07305 [Sesbania bispinosa]|nr:hypothetical protein SESBI_07305 [Sesbania bispinosa]